MTRRDKAQQDKGETIQDKQRQRQKQDKTKAGQSLASPYFLVLQTTGVQSMIQAKADWGKSVLAAGHLDQQSRVELEGESVGLRFLAGDSVEFRLD
jgi:hypothetical protein